MPAIPSPAKLPKDDSVPAMLWFTGSGRGIGFHTAQLLTLMGASVYITDLTSAAIAAAVANIMASDCGCVVNNTFLQLTQKPFGYCTSECCKLGRQHRSFETVTPSMHVTHHMRIYHSRLEEHMACNNSVCSAATIGMSAHGDSSDAAPRVLPSTKFCCRALPKLQCHACFTKHCQRSAFDPTLQGHRKGGAAHGPGRPALRRGVCACISAAAGRGAAARAGEQRRRQLHGPCALAHGSRCCRHPPGGCGSSVITMAHQIN